MDMEITQTETCRCGRAVICVTGVCSMCISEGRELLELYLTGQITMVKYMRELRRVRK
jgi:hypothetical protein